MASEQQRARQLLLAARANIGEQPGIKVTPEGTAHGWRVCIQPNQAAPRAEYERGCDRLLENRLPLSAEVIYVTRDEWRNLLECVLDEVAKREDDAAQTAEHTTANLPRPSVFSTCGTRITRTYDGVGEVSSVAMVPNSRIPKPDWFLVPAHRPPNVPDRVEGEQAQPHRVPELVLVADVDGEPVAGRA